MKKPSKKEIRDAVQKLKEKDSGSNETPEPNVGKLEPKKSTQRIRKQGV